MTFEEIFKTHYTYVVKYVMKIIKNQEVSESIAQDVFIQLYKTNWKEIENIKACLLKQLYIAHIITLDQKKGMN